MVPIEKRSKLCSLGSRTVGPYCLMGLKVLVWAICAGTMFYFEKGERFSQISHETIAPGRDYTLAKTARNHL